MELIYLSNDILLHILELLSVPDVLSVEQVCKTLRSVVATRHLWLTKLQSLDQPCAPNLPPYTTVDQLSCEDLRSIVTRAIRWLKTCKKSWIATRENSIRSTLLDTSVELSEEWTAQLTPGGKYLIVNGRVFTVINVRSGRKACQWQHFARVPEKFQRFSVEALSEDSFLVLHAYSNVASGTQVFDLFQVDHLEDNGRVQKISKSESPRKKDLAAMRQVTLREGFGIAIVSWNQTYAFLVWNWPSGQLFIINFDRRTWPEKMCIAAGRLFFVMVNYKGTTEQHSIESFSLNQLGASQRPIMSYGSLERCSANLDLRNGPDVHFETLHLALYNPALSNPSVCVQIVVVLGMEIESGDAFVLARRLLFNLSDAHASYHLLRRSTPKRCSYGRVEAANPRTGQIVLQVFEDPPALSEPSSPSSMSSGASRSESYMITEPEERIRLMGLDEDNEIFFSALSSRRARIFLDELSGAIVRLTHRGSRFQTETYYVH